MRTILHILGSAQAEGTGIARSVEILVRQIRTFRMEVWFLLDEGPLADEFRNLGIQVRFCRWRPTLASPLSPFKLWLALNKRKPDLVHQHFGGPRVGRILRSATSAPLLLHMCTRVIEREGTEPVRWNTRYATRVIAVSQAVAQCSDAPAEVVYPGVERGGAISNVNSTAPVIGMAGRLVPVKGIGTLIDAMRVVVQHFPDARLEIAGRGPELKRLQMRVADAGLGNSVVFLGWVQDLRPVIRRWTVYVQPSIDEGMPLALLEAMSEGVPVVSTIAGGTPEAIQDAVNGYLVASGDAGTMANRIISLLKDDDSRRATGERGRQHISEFFSAEQFAASVRKIYEEMLG